MLECLLFDCYMYCKLISMSTKTLQINGESVVGMNQSKVAAILRKSQPGIILLSVAR